MMTKTAFWTVYALKDEHDNVRYIGWTAFAPAKRLKQHMAEANRTKRGTHKLWWIRSMVKRGLAPTVHIIEQGIGSRWAEREIACIKHYRAMGCDLTNATDGGDGVLGLVMSPESIEKMAAHKRGKKLSPEHVKKVLVALHAPESRAKAAQSRRGVSLSEEHKRSLSRVRKGRTFGPLSEETKAKLSKATKGRPKSEETRNRMRAAQSKRVQECPISDETRAKMSAAKKGKPPSLETLAKMAETRAKNKVAKAQAPA